MRKAVLSLTVLTPSKRTMLTLFASCLVGMVALFGVGIRSAETQTTTTPKIQDLGTLGGSYSWASAINDSGQVVGYSYLAGDQNYHAFLYKDGMMEDLGTLPGGTSSEAKGINKSGQVVGWSDNSSGQRRAFLYDSSNGMKDLNDSIPADSGWTLYEAAGINTDGKIAASSYGNTQPDPSVVCDSFSGTGPPVGAALVLSPTTTANYEVKDLGTLGGYYSRATSINNSSQVVGQSYTAPCTGERAFFYDESADLKMQRLSMPAASGLNNSGKVVGYVEELINGMCVNYECWRAVLYDSATKQMQYLADRDTVASGINDDGDVVGTSGILRSNRYAFLKESGQLMVDLNTLFPADQGWTITSASAINGDDKMVANGTKDGGERHALLLTVTIPAAPTGLKATLSGSATRWTVQSINLLWTDNSTNETSFTVERSTDGNNWSTLTSTLSRNTTSYTDSSVSRRSSYYYRVKATNTAGSSDPSNVAGPVKTK